MDIKVVNYSVEGKIYLKCLKDREPSHNSEKNHFTQKKFFQKNLAFM